MSERVTIRAAGNVLAPALAELNALGFRVSLGPVEAGGQTYRAEGSEIVAIGSDTLQLLGLVVLASRRGRQATQPTDAEVDALLELDGAV